MPIFNNWFQGRKDPDDPSGRQRQAAENTRRTQAATAETNRREKLRLSRSTTGHTKTVKGSVLGIDDATTVKKKQLGT